MVWFGFARTLVNGYRLEIITSASTLSRERRPFQVTLAISAFHYENNQLCGILSYVQMQADTQFMQTEGLVEYI